MLNQKKYLEKTILPIDKPSVFSDKSDMELWKLFKQGDEGAFLFIYKSYVQLLYSIGTQFTKRTSLVKDCLQDLFLELRERRSHLGDTDNIKLYLIKSFRRSMIHSLNKEKRFVFQNVLKDSFAIEFAADVRMINSQLQEEQLSCLKKGLQSISQKDREIIYYYFYENLSYAEIANILGYNHVSSARRSIYKILKRLKKHFISS